jgi:serine/threonine protein phosphatase 1
MIYVCSDIHGCYDRFLKLLDKIHFSDDDELYILGDVIDRNKEGIPTLLYIMEHQKNIHLLMGNHEDFMYQYLHRQAVYKYAHGTDEYENDYDIWFADCNGGRVTYDAYKELDDQTKLNIFKFLSELPLIVLLEVNNKKYHLSHSGSIQKVLEKECWRVSDLGKYERTSIVWDSMYRYDGFLTLQSYPEGYISIFGHVPVQKIRNNITSYRIYKKENTIDIDSGCAYFSLENEGIQTRLSCFCLDTEKTVYIK